MARQRPSLGGPRQRLGILASHHAEPCRGVPMRVCAGVGSPLQGSPGLFRRVSHGVAMGLGCCAPLGLGEWRAVGAGYVEILRPVGAGGNGARLERVGGLSGAVFLGAIPGHDGACHFQFGKMCFGLWGISLRALRLCVRLFRRSCALCGPWSRQSVPLQIGDETGGRQRVAANVRSTRSVIGY